MSELDTINDILDKKRSCVRFGDGEFNLVRSQGRIGIAYQSGSSLLAERLLRILRDCQIKTNERCLICIPVFFSKDIKWSIYKKSSQQFWKYYIFRNIFWIRKVLCSSLVYGSAQISRPYINRVSYDETTKIFNAWKKVFFNRNIVVVEGEFTRFGVGNDLLEHAASIKRIICPSVNAFNYYDEILSKCLNQENNSLFILALGPASKPLVLDLIAAQGRVYQVLDLGHLDIEYEWFLRKAKTKISIPGKYVNESENNKVSDSIGMDQYLKQIVAKIPH